MILFRLFQHLLPRSKALNITIDKPLRQLYEGLADSGQGIIMASDSALLDIMPASTTRFDDYELQFGLDNTLTDDNARRERIVNVWGNMVGGQSPDYIQTAIRDAGFDVYLHGWWQDVPGRPNGGSINGDHEPVARDPETYLWNGVSQRRYYTLGNAEMQCGGELAFLGSQLDPQGYPLVNSLVNASQPLAGCGQNEMQCGGINTQCGAGFIRFDKLVYTIPTDEATWPHYIYIGASVFPLTATVSNTRRVEFENLCMKLCPADKWVGILVNYN